MRRTRSGCCARTESGHAAVPLSRVMNSRRLTRTFSPITRKPTNQMSRRPDMLRRDGCVTQVVWDRELDPSVVG
jgi:hypothetical protein